MRANKQTSVDLSILFSFIENTYYMRTNESIPLEQELRGPKYISYYQVRRAICLAANIFIYSVGAVYTHSTSVQLLHAASSLAIIQLGYRHANMFLTHYTQTFFVGYHIRAIITTARESPAFSIDENKEAVQKIARSIYYATQLRHRTLRFMDE